MLKLPNLGLKNCFKDLNEKKENVGRISYGFFLTWTNQLVLSYCWHKEIFKSFVYVPCSYHICVFCVEKCSRWFITLPDTDSSTDSDLDSKPDSYVVLCWTRYVNVNKMFVKGVDFVRVQNIYIRDVQLRWVITTQKRMFNILQVADLYYMVQYCIN